MNPVPLASTPHPAALRPIPGANPRYQFLPPAKGRGEGAVFNVERSFRRPNPKPLTTYKTSKGRTYSRLVDDRGLPCIVYHDSWASGVVRGHEFYFEAEDPQTFEELDQQVEDGYLRPVPGYESSYVVSREGRVYRRWEAYAGVGAHVPKRLLGTPKGRHSFVTLRDPSNPRLINEDGSLKPFQISEARVAALAWGKDVCPTLPPVLGPPRSEWGRKLEQLANRNR